MPRSRAAPPAPPPQEAPNEPPPGTEFLASLQALFNEASAKNLSSKQDLMMIKSAVLQFLAACETTTGARARARVPILLPNGKEPSTGIARPPYGLKLDLKARNRLLKMSTGTEFVGVLRTIINKQLGPKVPRTRKRKGDQGGTAKKAKLEKQDVGANAEAVTGDDPARAVAEQPSAGASVTEEVPSTISTTVMEIPGTTLPGQLDTQDGQSWKPDLTPTARDGPGPSDNGRVTVNGIVKTGEDVQTDAPNVAKATVSPAPALDEETEKSTEALVKDVTTRIDDTDVLPLPQDSPSDDHLEHATENITLGGADACQPGGSTGDVTIAGVPLQPVASSGDAQFVSRPIKLKLTHVGPSRPPFPQALLLDYLTKEISATTSEA